VAAMKMLRSSALLLGLVLAACDGSSPSGSDGGGSDGGGPPVADSDVVRMCLMNNACGFQSTLGIAADLCTNRVLELAEVGYVTSTPEHVVRDARMVECARSSTTCDEYVSCVRFGATCSGTVAGSCQGTIADRCSTPGGNYLPPIFDCALVGMTCDDSGTSATCVVPASAPDCADASAETCDGDTRVYCRPRSGGGLGEFRDACPTGTTCVGGGMNTPAYCMPAMASCATESATCDGDVAVWCLEEDGVFQELRHDCSASGRRCAADERGIARCVPPATECTAPSDGSSSARCDGNTLEVCVEGTLHRVDCASVGRSTCTTVPAIPGAQAETVACT